MAETMKPGTLYVVATPIGNLGDMSARGGELLRDVNRILAEDTRHTARLLDHLGINTPMTSLHEHNEQKQVERVLDWLAQGQSLALVSDAGTPLISDPGFELVRAARQRGFCISTAPGACAVTAALSISGLPTDRFVFEGFLPSRQAHRRRELEAVKDQERTLVFYESPRRILATLADMASIFGDSRAGVVVRELTKTYETVYAGGLGELAETGGITEKGEFVVLVQGAGKSTGKQAAMVEAERLLTRLLESLPVKEAVRITADITGAARTPLYQRALILQGKDV